MAKKETLNMCENENAKRLNEMLKVQASVNRQKPVMELMKREVWEEAIAGKLSDEYLVDVGDFILCMRGKKTVIDREQVEATFVDVPKTIEEMRKSKIEIAQAEARAKVLNEPMTYEELVAVYAHNQLDDAFRPKFDMRFMSEEPGNTLQARVKGRGTQD